MDSKYTSRDFLQEIYSDPLRIANRGLFLKEHSNRRLSVRDIIRMLMVEERKRYILDYGCGNGSFLRSVTSDPCIQKAYALDIIKHDDIAFLRDKVEYIDAANGLPDLGSRVDMVFCMNVLYHLTSAEIYGVLRWFDDILSIGGCIFITTKSDNNFPAFRALLDDLGLEYPGYADEQNFSAENSYAQITRVFAPDEYNITVYPLSTQIITHDFDAVIRYMLSNARYAKLENHVIAIKDALTQSKLYIDSYYEIIIRVQKLRDGV